MDLVLVNSLQTNCWKVNVVELPDNHFLLKYSYKRYAMFLVTIVTCFTIYVFLIIKLWYSHLHDATKRLLKLFIVNPLITYLMSCKIPDAAYVHISCHVEFPRLYMWFYASSDIIVLLSLNIWWSYTSRYCTQHNKDKNWMLVRLYTHKRHHIAINIRCLISSWEVSDCYISSYTVQCCYN